MPADPRSSGFFEPMGGPAPILGAGSAAPLVLRGGYRNVYGTRLNATYDPLTKEVGADTQFPVGDFQRQLFLGLSGRANPETKDWGATLSLTKKIAPKAPSAGEALNAITGGILGRPVPVQNGVMQADLRSNFMNSLSEDQLKMLSKDVQQYQRDAVDQALGVRPGAEKYGFELGFSAPGQGQSAPRGGVSIPQLAGNEYALPEGAYQGQEAESEDPGKKQLINFINERQMIQ